MKHETIKNLLEKYGITPNKVLGQNFLLNEQSVKDLIEAAEIKKEDIVIEVGPGTGVITKELAKYAGQVIAVEKDPNMMNVLREELKGLDNLEILNEDILKLEIKNSSYTLIGAPPYYLTGRLFRKFLEEAEIIPSSIALIIQKEVAEKICAKPPDMGLPAVSVQLYGEPEIVKIVPKNCFWPVPKIDSAILLVKNIQKPDINEDEFFKVVRAGFSSPRKQLLGNLSRNLNIERPKAEKMLKKCGISTKQRAETLSVEDWKKICSQILDFTDNG